MTLEKRAKRVLRPNPGQGSGDRCTNGIIDAPILSLSVHRIWIKDPQDKKLEK